MWFFVVVWLLGVAVGYLKAYHEQKRQFWDQLFGYTAFLFQSSWWSNQRFLDSAWPVGAVLLSALAGAVINRGSRALAGLP